jgi:BirA family biotin operon repressor/biotin-[acetyl-CoA-carboxylase] ligase
VTAPAAFWRLSVHESLGSTSDLCRARAEAGEAEGLAVLARTQTAGRGSRGRQWISDRGNLALSVLLRPTIPASEAGWFALLAGVCVAEALAPVADVRLKWPNDILFHGAKLGGVLIDTATSQNGGLDWLVIGMGVNLAQAPSGTGRAVAALDGTVPPEDVAIRLLDRIAVWRDRCDQSGWQALRAAWLGWAGPLGASVTLRQQNGEMVGAFAGLGDDGSLLLRIGSELRAFTTGEIWLPARPAELEISGC